MFNLSIQNNSSHLTKPISAASNSFTRSSTSFPNACCNQWCLLSFGNWGASLLIGTSKLAFETKKQGSSRDVRNSMSSGVGGNGWRWLACGQVEVITVIVHKSIVVLFVIHVVPIINVVNVVNIQQDCHWHPALTCCIPRFGQSP